MGPATFHPYTFGVKGKSQAPPGFEPGAAALQVQRSTTEL